MATAAPTKSNRAKKTTEAPKAAEVKKPEGGKKSPSFAKKADSIAKHASSGIDAGRSQIGRTVGGALGGAAGGALGALVGPHTASAGATIGGAIGGNLGHSLEVVLRRALHNRQAGPSREGSRPALPQVSRAARHTGTVGKPKESGWDRWNRKHGRK